MNVSHVAGVLESLAPTAAAADWDNVGLLIGDSKARVKTLMLCIDLTDAVLTEAQSAGASMVMAYHPPIFKPLARLTDQTAPVVWSAARANVAVYSMHTALDVAPGGTNDTLAEVLQLSDTRPLQPLTEPDQCKIVVFTPPADVSAVSTAAFAAGAGHIGDYSECSFRSDGTGTFRGGTSTRPTVGHRGKSEQTPELRLEMIAPQSQVAEIVSAIGQAHSYEQPAVDVYPLTALPGSTGQGRIGTFTRPATVKTLLARIKKATGLKHLLVAGKTTGTVTTAAVAAGSAGSMFRSATAEGATFYLTGEMRHHDALAATAAEMTVVCTGHSNSERPTLSRLAVRLRRELSGVKVLVSRKDRDPFDIH